MEQMARNLFANHLIPSLLIILLVQFHPSTQLSNFTDYSALTAFKSHIRSDPNGILSSNWSSSKSFCNWVGVSCTPSNDSIRRVTSLQLQGMGLQGTLAPQIANLSFLVVLDLSNNHFNGPLPSELSLLHHLKVFNVSRNNLQGTIPPSISHCKEFRELILSENTLIGTIPQELGTLRNLQILHLSYNNLTGRVPPSLGNITKLEFFYLHDNNLEGSIPREIGNLYNLVLLSFRGNDFTGPIPASIFNITTLQVVNLSINHLSGHLPMENATGTLNVPNLERLYLQSNQLQGHIPVSVASASKLEYLYLFENGFQGTIPHELGGLLHLKILRLQQNQLTGTIPSSIFNLSSLTGLDLRRNNLSGHIPKDIGVWLPNLDQIYLSNNQLTGALPSSISNASKITYLQISFNSFSGPVPSTLGHLTQLVVLNLQNNLLENEPGKTELCFLTSLVNCRNLKHLILRSNPLNGNLPETIGNLSNNLRVIDSASCGIKGNIPQGLGNLSSFLYYLGLDDNDLSGIIPASIVGLQNLERLNLARNRIEGPISAEIFSLGRLGQLSLRENMLFGSIPRLISNLTRLAVLSLAVNRLSSTIPSSFWKLERLRVINLSHNSLHGPVPPQVGNLKPMSYMDLSSNNLSGEIPEALGNLQLLLHLNLSSNLFTGPIPKSFSQLIIIQQMDLSSNALSGLIPKSLETLRDVQYMNFSFNKLEGEIPSGGAFTNLTPQSFMGNPALCGSPRFQVPPCLIHPSKTRPSRSRTVKIVIPIICAVLFSAICFSTLIIRRAKKVKSAAPVGRSLEIGQWRMVTVHELQHATHNFSEANLLGAGSFSRVYRGTLADGMDIAVKVLKLQLEGAQESFDAECRVMCNVRHRNLVKVITACSNLDFKALVLEFMPNESLDQWLHSHDKCLDLIQRLDIMIDVALAMEYLHHDYSVPIVHCDLKPSNVLLDDEMTAHVSDFGIAKLLAGDKPEMLTSTLGTIGYIAPEYGLDGRVSTSADVYSYGILLLETFTGKKPTDDMFTGGSSLHQWVSNAFPDAVTTVVDNILLMETGHNRRNGNREENENENPASIEELLVAIIHVGLSCARESPDQRSSMRDVVTKLKKSRLSLGA